MLGRGAMATLLCIGFLNFLCVWSDYNCKNAGEKREDDTSRCATYPLENKVKHTYQLVIWLEETGEEQPEQGMAFEGTVSIEVSGGFDSGEYGNGEITGQE